MGFFDSFKAKATDLAQTGVAQSKRLAEIAKLKANNLAEEDNIKKAYIEIGKLYYAEKGSTPDGAYVTAFDKISAAKAAIEANNERLAELKDDSSAAAEETVVEEAAEVVEAEVEAEAAAEEPKAE